MSGARILVLDIAGVDTAFATSSRGVAQWANTVSPVLKQGDVPPGMVLSVDPATGTSDAGGLTVYTTDISSHLQEVSITPYTTLDGAISATDTSITLTDALGLPSSGKVWIGKECVSYLTIVSNTLTTVTRGALGTQATSHADNAAAYDENPAFLGRRVELSWQDATAPSTSTAWTRFVGFIDDVAWQSGYYAIKIISASKLAMDSKGLATSFGKGSLSADFPGTLRDLYLDHTDSTNPWSVYTTTRGYTHIRVGGEIMKIEQAIRPSDTEAINSLTSPNRLFVDFPSKFRIGQMVDITDSSGTVQTGGEALTILDIYDAASASSYVDVGGIAGYSYTAGDELRANYTTVVPKGRISRGQFGTTITDHEAGAQVTEVRIFEGDAIEDILLPLLCSVDGSGTHGPASGAYDTLPSGWGAGIPAAYIDLDALRSISSSDRRYLWTSSVQLTDLLAWVAQTCNATVFWTEQGKLSAIRREDQYPGTVTSHILDGSWHRQGQIPGAEMRTASLYNAAEVKTDYDLITGEPTHTLFVELIESIERYGRRHIEIKDPGLLQSTSETLLGAALQGWLRYRALPYPVVTYPVRLQEGINYRPGQLVSLTVDHLPDNEGGKGLANTWEITEVNPADKDGQVDLSLIYRGPAPRVAYVAWSCIVAEVVSSTTFAVFPRSTTKLAPVTFSDILPYHQNDADEDVDWPKEGDKIRLWDKSTLGGTATTSDLVISSIDTANGHITTSASLPGWLAQGDIVRLQDYASFQGASTEADREGILLALADSTASPPDLDGDENYKWGI